MRNFWGAWIYKALPVEKPSAILRGAMKAFIFKYNIPIISILGVIFIVLYGPHIIPDVLLMLTNMLLLIMCFLKAESKKLPFSEDFQNMQQGTNAAMSFVLLLVAGLLALIHFGATFIPFGVTINIAVSAVVTMIIWHHCFKSTWDDILL